MMVTQFIKYVLEKNGPRKTVTNILVIIVAPWSLYLFSAFMNEIALLLRGQGVHAQNIGIYFLRYVCAGFSIYYLARYILTWLKFYRSDMKAKTLPRD